MKQFSNNTHSGQCGTSSRSGSALVIVLGLLAVLMLMAITFAITMRTERGGATNLRHAIVSRQMLDTAINRIMVDLDEELSGYKALDANNQEYYRVLPVAPWYIKTSVGVNNQHFRAGVLFSDVQKYFFGNTDTTISQRVAIRKAIPEWMPIYAGVKNQEYDSIQGRYAYVIVNNSGRMNVNSTNTQSYLGLAEPAKPYSSVREFLSANPSFENEFPLGTSSLAYDAPGTFTNTIPGGFSKNKPYGIRPRKFCLSKKLSSSAADYLGRPDNLNVSREQANRIINNFGSAFKESYRADPEVGEGKGRLAPYGRINTKIIDHYDAEGLHYRHVAAMALLDYIDEDIFPGGSEHGEYSEMLTAIKNDAGISAMKRLDLPCTEPVPLIHSFFAGISEKPEVEEYDGSNAAADDSWSNVVYEIKLASTAVWLDKDRKTADDDRSSEHFYIETEIVGIENQEAPFSPMSSSVEIQWTPTRSKGTYDYRPGNQDIRISDKTATSQPVGVLTFKGPWNAIKKARCALEVHGRVYSDSHGDEASEDEDEDTQWVPGPSFRNNQKLKLNFEIAYQDVKDYWDDHVDGDDIFVPQEAWAFVSDPRFAYDTTAFTDVDGSGIPSVWIHGYMGRGLQGANRIVDGFLDEMDEEEEAEGTSAGYLFGAAQVPFGYMKAIINEIPRNSTKIKELLGNGDSGLTLDQPDFVWSSKRTKAGGTQWGDLESKSAKTYTRNGYPETIGELGNLPLAPLRTISLFDGINWKSGDTGKVVTRHNVLDWFTTEQMESEGDADSDIVKNGNESRPAQLENYRVNLNPPFICEPDNGNPADCIDITSLASVINGAEISDVGGSSSHAITADEADAIAEDFFTRYAQSSILSVTKDSVTKKIFSFDGISGLGCGISDGTVLETLVDKAGNNVTMDCDSEREDFIRALERRLTTRQQVFTIIVQADAFTPAFGFAGSVDGSALASSKAILEIWRDPEPPRNGEGKVLCSHGSNVEGCPECNLNDGTSNNYISPKPNKWHLRYIHYY